VRRSAGARDDHPKAALTSCAPESDHGVGRAVGGEDLHLVWDAELVEGGSGIRHDRPVRVGTHDDGNGGF
jgi:hypothetical protein